MNYNIVVFSRESLYVKFDPLVGGRPSVMGRPSVAPYRRKEEERDLIAIDSPSPVRNKSREEAAGNDSTRQGDTSSELGERSGENTVLQAGGPDPKEEEKVGSCLSNTHTPLDTTIAYSLCDRRET